MANAHGWEMLCPSAFEALWTGGDGPEAIHVVRLNTGSGELPGNHFGAGVLTFVPGHLFRTESPYNLYVTGPPNIRKDGIAPLSAIVEATWAPYTFTMNWLFTRVGVPVRFEEGEPYCHFFPIHRTCVEEVEPAWGELADDPELQTRLHQWTESRLAFNSALHIPGTRAAQDEWQRFYTRGTFPTGETASKDHQTRLNVKPFPALAARQVSTSGDSIVTADHHHDLTHQP